MRAFLLLILLLAVVACEERADVGDIPYAHIVSRAIPKIERQTGLTFKELPRIERRSRDEVRMFVMKQLSSDRARAQITGMQSAYQVLGLVPDSLDLADLMQRLLEEQIVGYYDPATKVLYVVDGAADELLEQTVTHELVHALQDQYVNIDSIQSSTDNADRQSAAQAVLEGQAVFEQLRINQSTGSMLKMPGGWDRIRDLIRDGQDGMPIFGSAPRVIREGLLFPYLGGADFVRRFINVRPAGELLADLPVSTEQLLNDSAYFASPRDEPTAVTLPAIQGGTVVYDNTFGEFETRLILAEQLNDDGLVRRAASGIDGDRFAVVRTGGGNALVWASVWDTPVDAGDFLDVITDVIRRRYDMAKPDFPAGATTRQLRVPAARRWGARNVVVSLHEVSNRPVVLVIDAPANASVTMDASRITLAP